MILKWFGFLAHIVKSLLTIMGFFYFVLVNLRYIFYNLKIDYGA